ncbi:hypothetical protein P9112_004792 [Eukaryota sp. TZLM1-RC]
MQDIAYQQWLIENCVLTDDDMIFGEISETERKIREERPWKKDFQYFKNVRISAIALLKLVTHAHSGGNLEIMGVMSGRVIENTFVILDAFPLPVEGTETRVNAGADADVYMTQFRDLSEKLGRSEFMCGWYHSHPSYGCWLSGIDVMTQRTNQQMGPWVAVVIDPVRTAAAGSVEIGSFICYPDGYSPCKSSESWEVVPTSKIEDFGAHAGDYYQLKTSFFKTSRDEIVLSALWKRFWAQTLSSKPLLTSSDYLIDTIEDVVSKFKNKDDKSPASDNTTARLAIDLMGGVLHEVVQQRLNL